MELVTNSIMNGYLAQFGEDIPSITHPLNSDIKEILDSEFLINNDCITLKKLVDSNPILDDDTQKCWWEYNENHFHPDWQMIESPDELEFLKAGIVCARYLAKRLKSTFPDKSFRVIVSFYETDKNDPDSVIGSSTVRFYQVRKNFENEESLRQLEDFKTDAMLEITV